MAWVSVTDDVLVQGDNVLSFTAGGTIEKGQVVAFQATGADYTVIASASDGDLNVVGVALYDASSGEKVAVATTGCVVSCQGGEAVDAGDRVISFGATEEGTVGVANSLTIDSGSTTVTSTAANGAIISGSIGDEYIIGIALEDITDGGQGDVLLTL